MNDNRGIETLREQNKQLTIDLEIARARNDEFTGAIGAISAQIILQQSGDCSVPLDAIMRAANLINYKFNIPMPE